MHSHIVRMLELYHTHLNSGGVWKGQVLLKYGGYLRGYVSELYVWNLFGFVRQCCCDGLCSVYGRKVLPCGCSHRTPSMPGLRGWKVCCNKWKCQSIGLLGLHGWQIP